MYKINVIWEDVNYMYDSNMYSVVEPEDFQDKSMEFQISRNESFKIISNFEVNSGRIRSNFFDLTDSLLAGEIYKSEQKIRIQSHDSNEKYNFDKVYFTKRPSIHIGSKDITRKGEILISQFGYKNDSVEMTSNQYHVNWLLNINFDKFRLKNCHVYYFENKFEFSIDFKDLSHEKGFIYHDFRECIHLDYDGIDIFIGILPENCHKFDKKYKPGFIFFSKTVSEDFIKKFREAVAFMFGRPLVSLGVDTFNENGDVQEKSYLSPYIISDDIFTAISHMPSSFNVEDNYSLKYGEMYRFIKGIINEYDIKKLEHVFWMYWHSLFAAIHAQAGGFGAIIEYILSTLEIESTLIEKAKFKPFRIKIISDFKEFCNENEVSDIEIIKIIEDKINGLNTLPIAKKTKKQFLSLGIEMSDFEASLWQRRHDSAHGNHDEGHFNDLVREVNAFRSFCNRTIIKVLNNSDNYIDYYNYGYPVKLTCDSLEKST